MNERTKPSSATVQACVPMPDFERLNFFYGQALGVADFKTEQNYFLEKLRLYNRCFHGYGIVCGLEVTPAFSEVDCEDDILRQRRKLEMAIRQVDDRIAELEAALKHGRKDEEIKYELELRAEKEALQRLLDELPDCYPKEEKMSAEICVNCGWALDCEGREIVVRQPQKVELWTLLSPEQMQRVKAGVHQGNKRILIELSVCYCEQPTYPSRPVMTDTCAAVSKCVYGRTREGFKFRVNLTPSEPDKRCGNCCEACENECLVLAHIHWDPSAPITWRNIDWRPRRKVSLYQSTVITGVSWLHGARYLPDQAKIVLGTEPPKDPKTGDPLFPRTDGFEVVFSRPVYAETLQPGVVDLWRIQGPPGPSGMITHIEGGYVDKPDTGLIESFKYRDNTGETLNSGDRVLISIRGNFILDACCQPVDGEHVGGRVPQLQNYQSDDIDEDSLPPVPPCAQAPHQPWTSGNDRQGATFESWFFIN